MPLWDDIGYLTQAMVPADTLSASMFPRVYTKDLGEIGNFNRGMEWLGYDVSSKAIPQSVVDDFGRWFQMHYGLR